MIGKLDKQLKKDFAEETGSDVEVVSKRSEYGNVLGLSLSLFFVWIWCLSLNLKNCINRNQQIIFAEVQDRLSEVQLSRNQSKENLNAALK